MAVIKTCCGCLSTKSGTYTVLFIHFIGYLASIIQLGIGLSGNQLQTFWNTTVLSTQIYSQCNTTSFNSTWRCTALNDVGLDTKWVAIGLIITAAFLLVACIIAVVGTVKDSPWILMPWIVLDFLSFLTKLICCGMAIMMWTISLRASSADTSFLIAVSILVAVGLALSFYMWLCVVSHFQSLRELKELGFLDGGGKGGSTNDVTPFVMAGSVSGDSEADVEGSPDEEAVTEEVKSVTSKDGDGDEDSDDDSDDDSDESDDDDDDDDEDNKNDVENPKDPDSDKEGDSGENSGGSNELKY